MSVDRQSPVGTWGKWECKRVSRLRGDRHLGIEMQIVGSFRDITGQSLRAK